MCVYVCVHACVRACVLVRARVCVCVCVFVCNVRACLCNWIKSSRNRSEEQEGDRQTDRQTDTETETVTERSSVQNRFKMISWHIVQHKFHSCLVQFVRRHAGLLWRFLRPDRRAHQPQRSSALPASSVEEETGVLRLRPDQTNPLLRTARGLPQPAPAAVHPVNPTPGTERARGRVAGPRTSRGHREVTLTD